MKKLVLVLLLVVMATSLPNPRFKSSMKTGWKYVKSAPVAAVKVTGKFLKNHGMETVDVLGTGASMANDIDEIIDRHRQYEMMQQNLLNQQILISQITPPNTIKPTTDPVSNTISSKTYLIPDAPPSTDAIGRNMSAALAYYALLYNNPYNSHFAPSAPYPAPYYPGSYISPYHTLSGTNTSAIHTLATNKSAAYAALYNSVYNPYKNPSAPYLNPYYSVPYPAPYSPYYPAPYSAPYQAPYSVRYQPPNTAPSSAPNPLHSAPYQLPYSALYPITKQAPTLPN